MTILSMINHCNCLADIGSDHGYLVAHAVITGISQQGIAVELNRDPFEQTRRTMAMQGLTNLVDVRMGDGLAPLKEAEVDAICIAGMGGGTIRSILESGLEKTTAVKQLVLQPNVDARELRTSLLEHGFLISDETLVIDGDFVYQVIKAIPGVETKEYSALELEYGRYILAAGGSLLEQTLLRDISHLEKISKQIARGRGEAAEKKKQEVQEKIAELRLCLAGTDKSCS